MMFANEQAWRSDDEIRAGLREIWPAMQTASSAASARRACCPAA